MLELTLDPADFLESWAKRLFLIQIQKQYVAAMLLHEGVKAPSLRVAAGFGSFDSLPEQFYETLGRFDVCRKSGLTRELLIGFRIV